MATNCLALITTYKKQTNTESSSMKIMKAKTCPVHTKSFWYCTDVSERMPSKIKVTI